MTFVVSNPGPFSVSVFFSGKNLPTKIRLRKHSIVFNCLFFSVEITPILGDFRFCPKHHLDLVEEIKFHLGQTVIISAFYVFSWGFGLKTPPQLENPISIKNALCHRMLRVVGYI